MGLGRCDTDNDRKPLPKETGWVMPERRIKPNHETGQHDGTLKLVKLIPL